ncbi:alkene reductase [Falsiroseomonas sp. HW251]|uniref:alkene reductase n=1 Tax=Falsiroseomonas sp. HW251 TaxID=3390998 RepID=UPI003D3111E0
MTDILFTPTTLGDIPLANRIVMAPMTRSRAPGNVPTPLMATYYGQRAGAGLIVTEGTSPSADGLGYITIPGLFSDAQVQGWRGVTEAVHAKGGRIVAQIMHTGRISHPDNTGGLPVVAPSAVAAQGQMFTAGGMKPLPVPEALTEAGIERVIGDFAAAARNAVAAGFDGIEIHGANGYLVTQFLAPNANRREDRWGGSAENRARFALAVLDASIAAIGGGRVGIRLSPGNPFNDIADPAVEETYTHLFRELGKRDFAYLHLLGPKLDFDVPGLAKRLSGARLILNGGYDRDRAEVDLAAGRAEAIAFGTGFLANPDLPERLRRRAPLNAPDSATFYGGDAKGYTDYPALAA